MEGNPLLLKGTVHRILARGSTEPSPAQKYGLTFISLLPLWQQTKIKKLIVNHVLSYEPVQWTLHVKLVNNPYKSHYNDITFILIHKRYIVYFTTKACFTCLYFYIIFLSCRIYIHEIVNKINLFITINVFFLLGVS